jgi:hypothetical protein
LQPRSTAEGQTGKQEEIAGRVAKISLKEREIVISTLLREKIIFLRGNSACS